MEEPYRIHQGGKQYTVDKEIYDAINQDRNAIRYRARLRKACWTNRDQARMCEGDCADCRYASIPRVPDGSMARYHSMCIDHKYRTDTQMIYRCIDILADMQSVDPDGERIGLMIMEDYSQTSIAKHLGIPLSTYRSRLARIARILGGE